MRSLTLNSNGSGIFEPNHHQFTLEWVPGTLVIVHCGHAFEGLWLSELGSYVCEQTGRPASLRLVPGGALSLFAPAECMPNTRTPAARAEHEATVARTEANLRTKLMDTAVSGVLLTMHTGCPDIAFGSHVDPDVEARQLKWVLAGAGETVMKLTRDTGHSSLPVLTMGVRMLNGAAATAVIDDLNGPDGGNRAIRETAPAVLAQRLDALIAS